MNRNIQKSWDSLTELITNSKNILLSTHVNPDGDGLGSEIGFYYHLKSIDRKCRIINISPIPEIFKSLDPENCIETYSTSHDQWLKKVDLTILFDIGDYRRINEIYPQIKNSKIVLFDHHPLQKDNPYCLEVLDLGAPATGYMVWKYLKYLSNGMKDIDIISANALYAALITDTGSFRYESTHSDAHLMAASLLDLGVKPYEIHKSIYEQRSLSQVKLMSNVIQSLEFAYEGKVAWFKVDSKMLDSANAKAEDIEGFTEYIRSIKNVEVAFMIQEIDSSRYRINFRSSGKYIINDIAQSFGGGGHIYAAGAKVDAESSINVQNEILKKLEKKITYGN